MKKGEDYHQQGFTIIEVALVLAIAGLIFLMTFIALPALQRSSRDTQRKEAISLFVDAVKKYQSNNRGALPDGDWNSKLSNYLGSNFIDPSTGEAYSYTVSPCDKNDENSCNSSALTAIIQENFQAGRMVVVTQAKCSGDETTGAAPAANPRKFAILMRLEGGGVYCEGA